MCLKATDDFFFSFFVNAVVAAVAVAGVVDACFMLFLLCDWFSVYLCTDLVKFHSFKEPATSIHREKVKKKLNIYCKIVENRDAKEKKRRIYEQKIYWMKYSSK